MIMNLTEYLKSIDEYDRAYKFADRAGVTRPAIYDLLAMESRGKGRFHVGKHKHRKVLLETALKIRTASNGLISLEKLGRPSCSATLP